MTSVLVVEDDASLRLALCDNLEGEGYQVAAAASLAQARALGARDVVVLDVMLPDGSGLQLCRELRATAPGTRVLLLTARTLEDDVVEGLGAGADDYVAKPYRLRELLARIAALARRAAGDGGEAAALPLGDYRVELSTRTVRGPQGVVALTRTEFDLLRFLVGKQGAVASRQEILDAVWGEVTVDVHTVDNFVGALRRKLPGLAVKTVRGVGFRLAR